MVTYLTKTLRPPVSPPVTCSIPILFVFILVNDGLLGLGSSIVWRGRGLKWELGWRWNSLELGKLFVGGHEIFVSFLHIPLTPFHLCHSSNWRWASWPRSHWSWPWSYWLDISCVGVIGDQGGTRQSQQGWWGVHLRKHESRRRDPILRWQSWSLDGGLCSSWLKTGGHRGQWLEVVLIAANMTTIAHSISWGWIEVKGWLRYFVDRWWRNAVGIDVDIRLTNIKDCCIIVRGQRWGILRIVQGRWRMVKWILL